MSEPNAQADMAAAVDAMIADGSPGFGADVIEFRTADEINFELLESLLIEGLPRA